MSKILAVLPLALALACGGDAKKPDGAKKPEGKVEAPKADAPKGDAPKAEPPKPEGPATVELTKLGLKMDAPAGSTAGDGIVGGIMVQGPGLVVNIDIASDSRPKTVEDAQKEADMYSPKNIKTEKLADGWALTFENTGSMGASYFVNVRRDIGGKSYWCETTASQPEQQTNALAACKSLKQ